MFKTAILLACILSIGLSVPSVMPQIKPEFGIWSFDEGKGNVAKDYSANSRDGDIIVQRHFGDVEVGKSSTQTFTIEGVDDIISVTSSNPDVFEPSVPDIIIQGNIWPPPPVNHFDVTFTPPSVGDFDAAIHITCQLGEFPLIIVVVMWVSGCGVPGPGDVNDDGKVTPLDAALVMQHVTGTLTLNSDQQLRADVTGNGSLSSMDAALILQKITGLIVEFPVR